MILQVALGVPVISRAPNARVTEGDTFDYLWDGTALAGQRAIVPWGRNTVIGLVVSVTDHSDVEQSRLRKAIAVLDDIEPLNEGWIRLARFAAGYYQRTLGEVALSSLPSLLRRADRYRSSEQGYVSRSVVRMLKDAAGRQKIPLQPCQGLPLTPDQARACEAITASLSGEARFSPFLLFGVTGSGKTEVYVDAIVKALAQGRQALLMVPEINLTPQIESFLRSRMPGAVIMTLHSAMPEGVRAANWISAHHGYADVLLGTRLAALASLPRLGLIVVDEEHDASFKQQEGLRYSARDLAVMRAKENAIPIILGSATPSLESWHQAERGRYRRLEMTSRAPTFASLPEVRLADMRNEVPELGLLPTLKEAIDDCLARGEQALVFVNRRGYAPALACSACGWVSDCPRCSAHAVFHAADQRLHCHHCGWRSHVPAACPVCGNLDISALGRGTQRVEESLATSFPTARIARIDRDSTRRKGSAQQLIDRMHAGDIDILVGTQMVAKGHDFQRLTLVGVVDADSALYSHDFRAIERLVASLMQVAGRSGRAERPGQVIVQTRFTGHAAFAALKAQDFARFASAELESRRSAGLPPFRHLAILRAESRTLARSLNFLAMAREAGAADAVTHWVTLYDPVPMTLVRRAGIERAQLLVESASRRALQAFLPRMIAAVRELRPAVDWHVEVDPLEI